MCVFELRDIVQPIYRQPAKLLLAQRWIEVFDETRDLTTRDLRDHIGQLFGEGAVPKNQNSPIHLPTPSNKLADIDDLFISEIEMQRK